VGQRQPAVVDALQIQVKANPADDKMHMSASPDWRALSTICCKYLLQACHHSPDSGHSIQSEATARKLLQQACVLSIKGFAVGKTLPTLAASLMQ
jgi:hypothetical protein